MYTSITSKIFNVLWNFVIDAHTFTIKAIPSTVKPSNIKHIKLYNCIGWMYARSTFCRFPPYKCIPSLLPERCVTAAVKITSTKLLLPKLKSYGPCKLNKITIIIILLNSNVWQYTVCKHMVQICSRQESMKRSRLRSEFNSRPIIIFKYKLLM